MSIPTNFKGTKEDLIAMMNDMVHVLEMCPLKAICNVSTEEKIYMCYSYRYDDSCDLCIKAYVNENFEVINNE